MRANKPAQRTARALLVITAIVAGAILLPVQAGAANTFPDKPLRLIVPFSPRGTSDVVARILADQVGAKLGQTMVIDNRPGAGSTLGTAIAAQAPADGYTLLYSAKSVAINDSLYRGLPYHVLKDFAPVTLVQQTPYLFVASGSIPVKSVRDMIAMARARPGKLNYASGGTGTGPQMAMELLKLRLGLDIVHVPYKGSAPALRDVAGGYVQFQCSSLIAAMQFLGSGRLRALAVSTAKRTPLLPNVPTMIESGIAGYDESGWSGVLAPAGTPRVIIKKLNTAINEVLHHAEIVRRMRNEGSEPTGSTPGQYRERLESEVAKWADVVRRTGLRAN